MISNNNKMKNVFPKILFIILLAFNGCTETELVETNISSWNEGKVLFRIYHGHLSSQEQDPCTIFEMETESIYPCCNFMIDAEVRILSNRINIILRRVVRPTICLTSIGPASFIKELPLNPGTYALIIGTSNKSDTHELLVTDTSLVVIVGTSSLSIPKTTVAWKIPQKSFAFVGGTTIETAWMFHDFVDSIKAVPSIREFSFPVTGSVPYPTTSSGHWHDEPARYFLYNDESNFDSAGALLVRFTKRVIGNQQGIGFYLTNWWNKKYLSWMIQ
jgi:hypothetical protein